MNTFQKVIIIILASVFIGCFHSEEEVSIFKKNNNFHSSTSTDTTTDSSKEYGLPTSLERKFRIGVIQSDDYPEYYEVFTSIISGLQLMGWMNEEESLNKSNYGSNRAFIKGIQGSNYSDYLEFSPTMFFSFLADENNRNDTQFKKIMAMAKENKLDLVILLGTLASDEVLKDPEYKCNSLMDAVSDPIGSGFVKSVNDSGKEFLTARIDQNQYIRQVNLFSEVIDFKKLGLIYENSKNGRSYAAIDSVEEVAKRNKFQLITNHKVMAEPTVKEYQKAYKLYLDAIDEIAPKIDAIFLGISGGLEPDNLPKVVNKLIQYQLPSFTMEGSTAVEKGVMLGVSGKEAGLYNAKKLIKILKGSSPQSLDQNYEKTPKISINLKTAELIGYDIPIQVIRSADEIYK